MIEFGDYRLNHPERISTPAMVVFEHLVDANIAALCEMVGGENLMVHVKTHKSEVVTKKQIAAGIAGFKCSTLVEVEMVLAAGGRELVYVMPMVQAIKADRFAELAGSYADAELHAVVSRAEHVKVLGEAAARAGRTLSAMVDIDLGMHRSGCDPAGEAEAIYRAVWDEPGLRCGGIHAYNGHIHETDLAERDRLGEADVALVKELVGRLEGAGMEAATVVGGGSFTFPYFAREAGWYGSPGTSVYWDLGYGEAIPDMPFRAAAMVLCQVIDRHVDQGTFTTDLGSKSIASDPPMATRAGLIGHEVLEVVLQNEEHGVFRWAEALPEVGTYLLAVPRHVCPTTTMHRASLVVDVAGEVTGTWAHTARDR